MIMKIRMLANDNASGEKERFTGIRKSEITVSKVKIRVDRGELAAFVFQAKIC